MQDFRSSGYRGGVRLISLAVLVLLIWWALPPPLSLAGEETLHLPYALADGTFLIGHLTLPPGATPDKKVPVVVLIPGGKGKKGGYFWRRAQNYLEYKQIRDNLRDRYAVLAVEYVSWYYGDPREMESVLAAFQALKHVPQVDLERLAVIGQSHGGYLALMSVMQPGVEPRPKAAVSVSGVVDLASYVLYMREEELTRGGFMPQEAYHYITRKVPQALGWPPDRDEATRERYARRSLLTYVHLLQVPVLIIHGRGDQVVPVSQARMLLDALHNYGKTYESLEIPSGKLMGHFLFQRSEPAWEKITAFLAKYLK